MWTIGSIYPKPLETAGLHTCLFIETQSGVFSPFVCEKNICVWLLSSPLYLNDKNNWCNYVTSWNWTSGVYLSLFCIVHVFHVWLQNAMVQRGMATNAVFHTSGKNVQNTQFTQVWCCLQVVETFLFLLNFSLWFSFSFFFSLPNVECFS